MADLEPKSNRSTRASLIRPMLSRAVVVGRTGAARQITGRQEGDALSALADVVAQSMAITPEDYFEAVRQRGALGTQMPVFMERYDLLLTPTLPIAAFDVASLRPLTTARASGCTGRCFPIPST